MVAGGDCEAREVMEGPMDQVDVNGIREAVRKRYADVSSSTAGRFEYLTGRAGALALGYEPGMLDAIPDDILVAFCGVGNPFGLGPVQSGEAVLDVGCGAGVDLLIAAQLVGRNGRVCGLDLTPEMVEQARANLGRIGVPNADVAVGPAEAMPFQDGSFDVVISNGVLNLSPLKEQTYREIHRVLRRGGRLQFADIVLKGDLAPEVIGNLDAWSD
jgi:arsenite methyltransferase